MRLLTCILFAAVACGSTPDPGSPTGGTPSNPLDSHGTTENGDVGESSGLATGTSGVGSGLGSTSIVEGSTSGSGSGTSVGGSSSSGALSSSGSSTGPFVECDVTGTWVGEGSYFDAGDMMEHAVPVTMELEQLADPPASPCFFGPAGGFEVTGTYNGSVVQNGSFHPDTGELCLTYNNLYVVTHATVAANCSAMNGNWATEGFAYDYEVALSR